MTHLTSRILPHFLERKSRSAIINLSSQSIDCPFKDLTVYTATKAYNDLFSRCLAEDYVSKYYFILDKLDIISSRPCIVSTAGVNYTKDPLACSAKECARGTLKALGKQKKTAGHWTHSLQV
jgi:short-subunit dehydrogenase